MISVSDHNTIIAKSACQGTIEDKSAAVFTLLTRRARNIIAEAGHMLTLPASRLHTSSLTTVYKFIRDTYLPGHRGYILVELKVR